MTLPLLLLNIETVVDILEKCLKEDSIDTGVGLTKKSKIKLILLLLLFFNNFIYLFFF